MQEITPNDFEILFQDKIPEWLAVRIINAHLAYEPLSESEHKSLVVKFNNDILQKPFSRSGEERQNQWETGWSDNLKMLREVNDISALIPRYYGKYDILRWNGKFIRPAQKDLEYKILEIVEYWLFEKYFKNLPAVYEFGCGTAHNLLRVREINKNAKLFGLDWASASQEIISELVDRKMAENIKGFKFDFFNPDESIVLDKNSGACTIGALEQVGDRFSPFIDYLVKNKPAVCMHLETFTELLDPSNDLDGLTLAYAKKRNYLNGLLTYLKKLDADGKITIQKIQRTFIGSPYLEACSVVIWSSK